MISMIDTVLNALRNDNALKNLVNSRVYWIKPESQQFPRINFFEVLNTETESADDAEYADEIEIQVDIWSQGSTTPIAKEVQRIMRSLGFIHQALPDVYEENTKVFHKPILFTIIKEI
jgi:hypothetical protein